ncbi:hypothetical protein [Streptomyces sp. NPDC018000]
MATRPRTIAFSSGKRLPGTNAPRRMRTAVRAAFSAGSFLGGLVYGRRT